MWTCVLHVAECSNTFISLALNRIIRNSFVTAVVAVNRPPPLQIIQQLWIYMCWTAVRHIKLIWPSIESLTVKHIVIHFCNKDHTMRVYYRIQLIVGILKQCQWLLDFMMPFELWHDKIGEYLLTHKSWYIYRRNETTNSICKNNIKSKYVSIDFHWFLVQWETLQRVKISGK